ncbi:uncharacterized protein LTR77_004506 [Saxophila tyrrhenica]|uniref:Fork-head domain-containing protein n=1 Tax=Saxophila tyrrhenica TaxID=1690608 RepID=A0AAV9PCZ1_9PEZI|nr:hypothetical protein LTR77_004506 [Saxophila tyrrhenica]
MLPTSAQNLHFKVATNMGQENSKPERADTLPTNGATTPQAHQTMANGRPYASPSGSPPLPTAHSDRAGKPAVSNNRTPSGVKRSWEDYEGDGQSFDGFERKSRRRSPSPRRAAFSTRDHYSPPPVRTPRSPDYARHTFKPDRGDHWRPRHGQRHRSSALPSDPRHEREVERASDHRGLSYEPHSTSHRPESSGQDPFSDSLVQDHVFNGRSLGQLENGHQERPFPSSYTWTNPNLPIKRNSTTGPRQPQTLDVAGPRTTVDYEGLRGVPTGPKNMKSGPNDIKNDPNPEFSALCSEFFPSGINPAVARYPNIFIPARSLPPKAATISHLKRFLTFNQGASLDLKVLADPFGYLIVFDDTLKGRKELNRCFETKNQEFMFGEYVLEMIPFPDGRPPVEATPSGTLHRMAGNEGEHDSAHRESRATEIAEALQVASVFRQPQSKLQAGKAISDNSAAVESRSPVPEEHNVKGSSPSMPDGASRSNLRSSPLLARKERGDSSSSVSSLTDRSASRPRRCHVCKGPVADTDSLVQCSSCPRGYHRRCHPQPSVPSHLSPGHSWQCRRCIKKQVPPPKSGLSTATSAPAGSPAPSVGQLEEPSSFAKLPNGHAQEAEAEPDLASQSGIPETDASYKLSHPPVDYPMRDHTKASLPEVAELVTDVTLSGEPMREDVEDLVEQSFAEQKLQIEEDVRPPKKTKYNFTRKKQLSSQTHALSSGAQDACSLQQRGTEHPTTNVQSELGSPDTPKRKPHRWPGGGADRDIIKAGIINFFPDTHKTGNEQISQQRPPLQESTGTGTATTVTEVPESPDVPQSIIHMRGAPPVRHPTTGPALLRTSSRDVSMDEAMLLTNGVTASGAPSEARSLKPSKPRALNCGRCGRTMPFIPSQKKLQLCSKCRKNEREGAEPSAVGLALKVPANSTDKATSVPEGDAASVGEIQLPKPVPEPTEKGILVTNGTAAPSPELVKDDAGQTGKEVNDPPGLQMDRASEVPDVSPPTPKLSTKPRTACEDCRLHRKRCTHLVRKSVVEQLGLQLDGADSDTDLWNPSPSPPSFQTAAANGEIESHVSAGVTNGQEPEGFEHDTSELSSRSLSPEPDSGIDEPAQSSKDQKVRRRTHTVAAKHEHDLGDSYERPKNTYVKLIGMAFCANPGRPMTTRAVSEWVAENIPRYELKKGNDWEKHIGATMSLRRLNNSGGTVPLWKHLDRPASAKANAPLYWELLPGMENKLLHWDPVLKECRSPDQSSTARQMVESWKKQESKEEDPEAKAAASWAPENVQSSKPTCHESAAGSKKSSRHTLLPDSAAATPPLPKPAYAESASSEEEPLLLSSRKRSSALPTAQPSEMDPDNVEVDAPQGEVVSAPTTANLQNVDQDLAPAVIQVDPVIPPATLLEAIKQDSEDVNGSAKSLFEEWPQYDLANDFDYTAKVAEIKKRPNRKKRSAQRVDPWTSDWKPARLADKVDSSRQSSVAGDRSTRAARKSLHNSQMWDVDNSIVKQCDTIEELFGLPQNPIATWHDDRLAFRDGTRNEDGSLPRAREMFKTGYA